MENGVEQTKTADVHNVVQVFNPLHLDDNGGDSDDGAVSELKLVDNVVRVFHEDDNDDDVFEEAINENAPHSQDEIVAEANGTHAHVEKFEEALDSELPTSGDQNPFEPVSSDVLVSEEEVQNDFVSDGDARGDAEDDSSAVMPKEEDVETVKQLQSDDSPNAVLSNGEEDDDDEVSALVANGEHENTPGITTTKTADGAVSQFKLVDKIVQVFQQGEDNGNEDNYVETKPLPDAQVESNKEEDDSQVSASIANGETKLLSDTALESNEEEVNTLVSDKGSLNGSDIEEPEIMAEANAVVDDKSANGSLHTSELEESETKAESSDLSSFVSGEIASSEQNKFDEQTPSVDDQCLSSNVDASEHGIVENGKTENGVSEELDLDEKSAVLANLADVDKVSSVENAPTDGIESVPVVLSDGKDFEERVISSQDDQKGDTRDVAPSVASFLKEDISGTPEIKQSQTDAVVVERAKPNAAELKEESSHYVQAQHNSEIIQEAQERQTQGTQDRSRKQHSASVEKPHDPSSAGEPEKNPAVEPVPAPPRRPAGLGAAAPFFEPASRALQQPRVNGSGPQRQAQLVEDPVNGEGEENDETREKLQMIRVKFLRLAHRLGQTPHNVVVAQVLYRLGLAEQLRGRNSGRVGAFSFDRASAIAEQLESAGQEPLDFSCTIMVIGKSGVGKSATINSIFDEMKFNTDAFQVGTKKVQDVVGTVQGIKVRVIDTPGLLPCWSDQRQNEKILHSVKQFIKKTPPDIVLYLDRLDMQSRDFGDLPLLRTITEIFGPSIWFNAIVVLTHAASAPPDGPNGISSSYEMFVTQRSHVVQQAIRQAAGDMRLMNPVSLVENHSACRTNRAGQRVLPNGQVWKPHLLLLSFASKILAEANTLLKLQDNPPGKPFATRPRVPPLPYLLSLLLQSRPQLKLPEEQFGDDDDLDDLDGSSDSDDESEYDELPPFKPLTKAQLAKLSRAQKKAYFDELSYREKLFMKRQLKEEKKRRKLLKKMGDAAREAPTDYNENTEEESGGGASVPVAMPDFSLPASFDSDNPSHRYRFLDNSNPWLVRPVLETHGWDHDVGYEGVNVERLFVVKDKIPVSFSGQATKDKKESNLQVELASTIKHNEGKATSLGFDMQQVGKDMSYTLRSETRFSNFRHNKTAAGLSVTLLGDAVTAGMKLEDRLIVNDRFRMVVTGGAMTARGDIAYGGSLEATLRDKDYPLGRMLSTLGLSIMDWHGELAIGCNMQSQIPIGRSSNVIGRFNLNNKGSGQITVRLNSAEQLQIALVGLWPIFRKGLALYQQNMHGE